MKIIEVYPLRLGLLQALGSFIIGKKTVVREASGWLAGYVGTRRAAAMLGEMDPIDADGMLPRRNVLVS